MVQHSENVMNNNQQMPAPSPNNNDNATRSAALIGYLCLIAGYFTVVFWLVGGIWSIVKRKDADASFYAGHLNNIISVFWWGGGLTIIGLALAPFIIGYFILLGVFVWTVYRIVKGLALLTSNKTFPL